jgi:hypothetical protein
MDKAIPWTKVTADYLQGIQPKELSKKYDIPVAVIHRKLSANGTTQKLREVKSSLQDEIRSKIEKASSKVIDRLFKIVESDDATNSDVVAAARAILDVSGLKSQKLETTITELPVIKDDIPE